MIPTVHVGNTVVFLFNGVEVPAIVQQVENGLVSALAFPIGGENRHVAGPYGFNEGEYHFPGERTA